MITVNGSVDQITITPANLETGNPPVEMADVIISLAMPQGAGACHVVVPNAAMGGIAVGPARIMVESA